MNKFYIIVPAVLLAAFIYVYSGFLKDLDIQDQQRAVEAAKVQAEITAKKKAADESALTDALKRQEEREKADHERELKKKQEQAAIDAQVLNDTQRYLENIATYTKQYAQLQHEIEVLRTKKETEERQAFDVLKQTELSRIGRRTAEMEIQRIVDQIAKKADASLLAAMPPPVAAPATAQ